MPQKRISDATTPAAAAAGPEKSKRTRARSTAAGSRTQKPRTETGAASISNLAGAVSSNGGASVSPDHAEIARLAYSYWEARGCQGGSPEEDWHRAEQELRGRAFVAVGA
jgi:hypothetical protein